MGRTLKADKQDPSKNAVNFSSTFSSWLLGGYFKNTDGDTQIDPTDSHSIISPKWLMFILGLWFWANIK